MTIQIPTEDQAPTRDIGRKVILIYGQPKIGKSTFCAGAPAALFLATEPGQSHLKLRRIAITSWGEFLEACTVIAQGKHDRQTIVIDTIDNLYKFCRDHILKKFGIQHEQDKGFGAGYDLVNGAFHKALVGLSLLPYGLMMISHAQEKEVKNRVGKVSSKIAPTLPKGAQKIVNGMADYIIYADIEEMADDEGNITDYQRVIRTTPTTVYEAGMRLEKGQTVPEILPLDYSAFRAAVEGTEQVQQTTQAVKPQSQSQSTVKHGGTK